MTVSELKPNALAAPVLFPREVREQPVRETTAVALLPSESGLIKFGWLGVHHENLNAADISTVVETAVSPGENQGAAPRSVSILPEVSSQWYGRPGLAGHRLGGKPAAGRDWATAFETRSVTIGTATVTVQADDPRAGLALRTEVDSAAGGSLRIRHILTNLGSDPYVVDHLDVIVPIDQRATESLDMTGRWGHERSPQRHVITDGVWLREGRTGRPGFDSPTVLTAGTAGFGFSSGEVWGVHVAWSGNTRHFIEALPSGTKTVGGGELLLPGEVVLAKGESYSSPWLFVAASEHGLDGLAAQFHDYVRSLPAHPSGVRPVVCNVWEAVYFDHNIDRLRQLADQAAEIGIERFVLDDGWFASRRSDESGLGDWVVSHDVWPDGLSPIADYVVGLGMQFGLWFEPEMVNRDSDLYRAHPDWILSIGDRDPQLSRNQLVLDLGRPQVRDYLLGQIDAVLDEYPISYVKWDHNRPLADAGSGIRADAPGVREQTLGYYALLDELRRRHPDVEWESCASGGGRIDLAVAELVERFWTSDMTDALSRQLIQRWTGQLVPPEYLGAHVAAPTNHQTGRQFTLDFRAATAFFGSFGVEWDVTSASETDRSLLGDWIALHKSHRQLLHSGRAFRLDSSDERNYVYGVLAHDGSEAVVAYAQLDETVHEPVPFVISGLDPARRYRADQILPKGSSETPRWRGDGVSFSGAVLATMGLPAPDRQPLSVTLVHLVALS
jgi:alpha-galactosidase